MTDYLDFELEIERVGKGRKYRARVRKAPAGRGARTRNLVLPSLEELDDLRNALGTVRSGGASRNLRIDAPSQDSSADFGRRLFLSIFKGEVLESWRSSLFRAPSGLRLRLSLDNDPHLLSVPWELLFDPELKEFIATTIPVVRTLDAPMAHQRALAGPGPLRILTILSSPSDYTALDTRQEWSVLDRAFGDSVELRSIPPMLDKIDQALQSEEWHVLHFVGHGSSDEEGGSLVLEDGQRSSRPIDHLKLSKFLGHPALRLVVLNACYGGVPGSSDPFSGVAQSLLRKGIPAVVAMQQPISDRAAIALAEILYDGIAEGLPLDAALLKARARLYRDFDSEWAIPVLYLNARNGTIIGEKELPPPPPPLRPRWQIALITAGLLLISLIVWMSLREPGHPAVETTQSLASEPPKPLRPASDNPPDCRLPEGLEISFVRINGDTFEMGDKSAKETRPVHQVTITKPFCLSTYEVTLELWNRVLGRPAPSDNERHLPVGGVTYEEVQQFFERLNKLDSSAHYRLPYEAEWELAARAGTKTRYSFGKSDGPLYLYGNCNGSKDRFPEIAPVGQLQANPWGLFDMYGNVSEWVEGWYEGYPKEAVKDPGGPDTGTKRIRRGGNWDSSARSCSSVDRSAVEPERDNQDTGFRIVREIPR
jgi:formylglycine-generating enzyme required for sulfatase activity